MTALRRRGWRSSLSDAPRGGWSAPGFVQSGLRALYDYELVRRNLLRYSEDLDNSAWSATNVTVSANDATDPRGDTFADTLTASAADGTLLQAISGLSGSHTFGLYLRRVTGSGDIQLTVDGGSTWTTVAVDTTLTRYTVTGTPSSVGIRIRTSGDAVEAAWASLNEGSTALPYVPTTDKQAVYDRSGFFRDLTRGSVGSAHVNPDGALVLTGNSGDNISFPNQSGATDYWAVTHPDGSTTDGSSASDPVEIGNTTSLDPITKIEVFDDSGRTNLVLTGLISDAPGDVTRFESGGETWTINQATAGDTNDPTVTGEGWDLDGTDDYGGVALPLDDPSNPWHMFAVGDRDAEAGVRILASMAANGTSSEEHVSVAFQDTAVKIATDGKTPGTGSPLPLGFAMLALNSVDPVLSIYTNGEFDYDVTPSPAIAWADLDLLWVAARNNLSDAPADVFTSTVSLVALYDRALSAAEIAQNYRAAQALLAQRGVTL